MKRNRILILFIVLVNLHHTSFGQDAKEILQKSFQKCQSVLSGYYEFDDYMKYISENDTSKSTHRCWFRKIKNDSLFSSVYQLQNFYEGNWYPSWKYTGNELVSFMTKDSVATIYDKVKWADYIQQIKHNLDFYSPLSNSMSSPIPHDSDLINPENVFRFIGEEELNDIKCYNIQMNELPDSVGQADSDIKTLKHELHFWISKKDFLPLQFSVAFDLFMNNDTMYQYEKFVLTKYELNKIQDESILTMQSIPTWYKLKDYVPYKSPEPLKNDTLAPGWNLISLNGDSVSLSSLKGKILLIDFFYKSCYPCMQALPALEALHQKYKDSTVMVIGIDPYDKVEDGIKEFLVKRGVTYRILLADKELPKLYHVSGYPTLYIINREGKIIHSQVGYGKGTEDELEEIIKQQL